MKTGKRKFVKTDDLLEVGDVIIGDKTWHLTDKGDGDNCYNVNQRADRKQDPLSSEMIDRAFLVTEAQYEHGKSPPPGVHSNAYRVRLKELNEKNELKEGGLSLSFFQATRGYKYVVEETRRIGCKKPIPIKPVEQTFEPFKPI